MHIHQHLILALASLVSCAWPTLGLAADDDEQVARLSHSVGCGQEYEEVRELSRTSEVNSKDADYQQYTNSFARELISRRPNQRIEAADLLFLFGVRPVREMARYFPRRDQPSSREQLSHGLRTAQAAMRTESQYSKSGSAVARLVASSTKLTGCLADKLPVPSFVKIREDFAAAVSAKGCADDFDDIMKRVSPRYRPAVASVMALQLRPGMVDQAAETALAGRQYRTAPVKFVQALDDLFEAGVAAKQAELAKQHATLPSEADDLRLRSAQDNVAKLSFWACFLTPEAVKQDAGSTFAQFVAQMAGDGSYSCDLAICRMTLDNGKTALNCPTRYMCSPRASASGSAQTGWCPRGAWQLNKYQLEAYFKPDANHLRVICKTG